MDKNIENLEQDALNEINEALAEPTIDEPVKKSTTKKKNTGKQPLSANNALMEDDTSIFKTEKESKGTSVTKEYKQNLKINDDSNFLDNIIINIDQIDIIEKSEIEKSENFQFILNGKPTYQVVASQSCYSAFVEPLKMSDINAITNSTMDAYQSRLKLYQTIWGRINTTSLGKLNFQDWLKITSFFDINTIMYGLYMQTFPGNTEFQVRCKHCEKSVEIKINNDTLISAKDDNIFKRMEEIRNSITTPDEALEHSLLSVYKRIILPDSKIIIELQTPSLKNHLELLASVDPKKIEDYQDYLTSMLFIKNAFMLDVKETKRTGVAKYFVLDSRGDKFNMLRNLSVTDMRKLSNEMYDNVNKYAVDYKIRSFKCSNCGKEVGDIPIDVEELLFQQILQA